MLENKFTDQMNIVEELFLINPDKMRNKIPKVRVVLGNNMTYDQLISVKVRDMQNRETEQALFGQEDYLATDPNVAAFQKIKISQNQKKN